MIKAILLDAANTIIHKPELWNRLDAVLTDHNFSISMSDLKRNHKIISETTDFPDKTDASFYRQFNTSLLYSLGILPTQQLLDDIFKACDNLPWMAFDDTKALGDIKHPVSILSNFHGSLGKLISELFRIDFSHFIISENENVRKPDVAFYQLAIKKIGLNPEQILYVGDSIRLDMEPALSLKMNAILIDRENYYPAFKNRIRSFADLAEVINRLKKGE